MTERSERRIDIRHLLGIALLALVMGASVFASAFIPEDVSVLLTENRYLSALIFALLMCGATVIAPITLLPAVPMVAPILGPFLTGISCALGWTLGAVIAFLIARHGGRPIMCHFLNLRTLEQFESRIPSEAHFFLILALRLVIPVDVLSYALGLFSSVSLSVYTLATSLGVLWFSFAFAYLGYAVKEQDSVLFATYSVLSALIVLSALWYVRKSMRK